jgi:hypothetical protein
MVKQEEPRGDSVHAGLITQKVNFLIVQKCPDGWPLDGTVRAHFEIRPLWAGIAHFTLAAVGRWAWLLQLELPESFAVLWKRCLLGLTPHPIASSS